MKKLVIISIVAALLFTTGAVSAQSSQQHEVSVRLPNVLMIRIIDTANGNSPIESPSPVLFDFSGQDAATFDPSGTLDPTSTSHNWNDIVVLANGGGWTVYVSTDNDDFEWDKVSFTHNDGVFTLPVDDTASLVTSGSRTNGWQSLGISPTSFSLVLDATEEAGDFTTTVTYSFTNP